MSDHVKICQVSWKLSLLWWIAQSSKFWCLSINTGVAMGQDWASLAK